MPRKRQLSTCTTSTKPAGPSPRRCTLARSTLGVVQVQLDLYAAREARLVAERDGAATIAFPPRPADARELPASASAGELRLFQSRRDSRVGQHGRLRERVAQTN